MLVNNNQFSDGGKDMCTAVTYKTKNLYFGRTLDYEYSYKEEITITPRNYKFQIQKSRSNKKLLCYNRNGICFRKLPIIL